jgi:hypothetical protein
MYKGEPSKGVEFFNLLYESEDFTEELGKVTLAAGRLESEIILYYLRNGIEENFSRLTLGQLIKVGKKNNLLDKNLVNALELICMQRNYLTHNIYALFIDLIDETILEKRNLIDTDVLTYVDRAWQLKTNLNGLADIISRK